MAQNCETILQRNANCADCGSQSPAFGCLPFGVIVCALCAKVHQEFGVKVCQVKPMATQHWKAEELNTFCSRGNDNVNAELEKMIDQHPLKSCESVTSEERVSFIRDKYLHAKFKSADDHAADESATATKPVVQVAKRLVDYFVVVGGSRLAKRQNLTNTNSFLDVAIEPKILQQYPTVREDTQLPAHVPQFAFPNGFTLSTTKDDPTFFNFVLTNVDGIRIYVCALSFRESLSMMDMIQLLKVEDKMDEQDPLNSSNLPAWISRIKDGTYESKKTIYMPKALLIVSHYPFLCAFREFLLQLYRVSLSKSPIPIERYIANFVCEIPLPPLGQIQVQFTLPDRTVTISRPPINKLPMVNFPFRPLFQLLDVDNVLLVFSSLLTERKIAICSKYVGILTCITETLQALLFPFSWQGAYIPVLPSTLLDVVDAPVPFLVGVHSSYLVKRKHDLPSEVTFVDLDNNRVTFPKDDYGQDVLPPKLPDRDMSKLRAKILEFAGVFDPKATEVSNMDKAYQQNEFLYPIGNFASDSGVTVPSADPNSLLSEKVKSKKIPFSIRSNSIDITSISRTQSARTTHSNSLAPSQAIFRPPEILVDSKHNESSDFSTIEIRKGFLRFFTSVLKKYAAYINMSSKTNLSEQLFDTAGFLKDNFDHGTKGFMSELVESQMFERFCEDRVCNINLPEVRFFDESINEKMNRSVSIIGKKLDTQFLDDTSYEIKETFVTPLPSTLGLPDDGSTYEYTAFPEVRPSFFGQVRQPRELFETPEQRQCQKSHIEFHQRVYTQARKMSGHVTSMDTTYKAIIKIQSQYRMYRNRRRYTIELRCAGRIQVWYRSTLQKISTRTHYYCMVQSIIKIQSILRMYRMRNFHQKKLRAALVLQSIGKMYCCRMRYIQLCRSILCLQGFYRMRHIRNKFKALKAATVRMQALGRGQLIRQKCLRMRSKKILDLRSKIFSNWRRLNVPLIYRTLFWLTFASPSYVNLGIHLQETQHLEDKFDSWIATKDSISKSLLLPRNKFVFASFKPTAQANTSRGGKNTTYEHASSKIQRERYTMYLNLKANQHHDKMEWYNAMGLHEIMKKRKQTLIAKLWEDIAYADGSAHIVAQLSRNEDRIQAETHIQKCQTDRLNFNYRAIANASFQSLLSPKHSEISFTSTALSISPNCTTTK